MSVFTKHTTETAPQGAAEVLAKVQERYGFIPNLAAFVAESPVTLGALLGLVKAFDETSFSPQEQQIVLLTVSLTNGCAYCKTVHTALSRQSGLDDATLQALLNFDPLPDSKQNALRDFAQSVAQQRGHLDEGTVEAFLQAGYSKAQVFEVVLGVSMKTLTNYSNHLAGAEPNAEFLAMAEAAPA